MLRALSSRISHGAKVFMCPSHQDHRSRGPSPPETFSVYQLYQRNRRDVDMILIYLLVFAMIGALNLI